MDNNNTYYISNKYFYIYYANLVTRLLNNSIEYWSQTPFLFPVRPLLSKSMQLKFSVNFFCQRKLTTKSIGYF